MTLSLFLTVYAILPLSVLSVCTLSSECSLGYSCQPINTIYRECKPSIGNGAVPSFPTSPSSLCTYSSECPFNQQCVLIGAGMKECMDIAPPIVPSECIVDNNCGTGYSCRRNGVFECTERRQCQRDADCPVGKSCTDTGECLDTAPPLPNPPVNDCILSSDCSSGYSCMKNGHMECTSTVCQYNTDCPNGKSCVENNDGLRECLEIAPPLPNPPVNDCILSSDCSSGYSCRKNGHMECTSTVCQYNTDCPNGQSCVQNNEGLRECLDSVNHLSTDCIIDHSCASQYSCQLNGKQTCTQPDQTTTPQRNPILSIGTWWSSCSSSYDCMVDLSCYWISGGRNVCAAMDVSSCISDSNCPSSRCLRSHPGDVMVKNSLKGKRNTNQINGRSNGRDVLGFPQSNPLVTVPSEEREQRNGESADNKEYGIGLTYCLFDYQCRVGEMCRDSVIDREGKERKVCRYDVRNMNKTCIYNADCLPGQRCLRSQSGTFICTLSLQAALQKIPCTWDYECSYGEKCVRVNEKGRELFLCRLRVLDDPHRNQLCSSNAQCPYPQICRHVSSSMNQCVDYTPTTSVLYKH